MTPWIAAGVALGEKANKVQRVDEEGTEEIARGYELKRQCSCEGHIWEERVLVVQSSTWAHALRHHVAKRLEKATKELLA